MAKLVKTRNIWIGLAVCGILYLALNVFDSHTLWYYSMAGLGLVRIFRAMPVWMYVIFGVLVGGVAAAAAACTALKGKVTGIIFSALNLFFALVLLVGSIRAKVAVMTVGAVFWLVIGILQLIYSIVKKGGTAFFIATLILAVVSLLISLALTCMSVNFMGDAYRWKGFKYWSHPRFLSQTLFSGKTYLYTMGSSACAFFPVSRALLMALMAVGFLRFGKTIEVPDWDPRVAPKAPKTAPVRPAPVGEAFASAGTIRPAETIRRESSPNPYEPGRPASFGAPAPLSADPEPFASAGAEPYGGTIRIGDADSSEAFAAPAGAEPYGGTIRIGDTDSSEAFAAPAGAEPYGGTIRIGDTDSSEAFVAPAGAEWSGTVSVESEPAALQEDPLEMLRNLALLRDQGILTEEEFLQKKTDILSKM